jgi:hypothetical protein
MMNTIDNPKARLSIAERLDRHSIPEPNSGCWLWIGGSRNAYGHGCMGIGGRTVMAHRAAWMVKHGDIPEGMLVLHRCDTPGCINPDHLFLGTQQDNENDKVAKGRQARGAALAHTRARGARNGNAKLTESDVLAIRGAEAPQRALAKRFGVTQAIISKIKRREVWTHV